jgi:hypothetical protein
MDTNIIVTPGKTSEEFFESDIGINEAARIFKVNKGQISRDSNNNSLSYKLDDSGNKRYQVKELYLKYGFRTIKETSNEELGNHNDNHLETTATLSQLQPAQITEIEVLKAKLEAKEDVIRRQEDEIRDLRLKQDRQLDAVQRLTMLLSAPKDEKIEPPAPLPQKQPFWKRLFS